MPIRIVRNDITRIRADAIVNSTNPYLKCAGYGVDGSIHAAAGPELQKALNKLSPCEVGSAVATPSFGIAGCKHIFHAVAPMYLDGMHGERDMLESCYRRIFELAEEYRCRSLAMPVLAAGAYDYPKAEAYYIATAAARQALEKNVDMNIIIVLFDKQLTEIASAVESDLEQYITDSYGDMQHEVISGFYSAMDQISGPEPESYEPVPFSAEDIVSRYNPESRKATAAIPIGIRVDQLLSERHIKPHDFLIASNLTKSALNKMRKFGCNPEKYTCLACAFGLKLSVEETNDLLSYAGYCLSGSNVRDITVAYYLSKEQYNIYNVNIILSDMDIHCLGMR